MSRTFTFEIRPPYAHTDQMGFVYHAHYLLYFEMARAQMLREVNLPYTEMEARGTLLPVVDAHCHYHLPGRFDDPLVVHSTPQPLKGAKLRIEYAITRGDDTLVTGHTEHVCMDRQGRVKRPDPELSALVNA